jgi:hypothetical protein
MADLADTPTHGIPKSVDSFELANASAVVYTVPAGTATEVKQIALTNTGAAAVTATIHRCPNGAAEGNSNMLEKAINVPSDGKALVLNYDGLYMNATDTLEAFASAANQVTCHISIMEWS